MGVATGAAAAARENFAASQEAALGFISELRSFVTTEQLTAGLLRHAAGFGIQTAVLVRLAAPGQPVSPAAVFGQGDPRWGAAYLEAEAYRQDPAVPAIFSAGRPFFWSDLVAGLGRADRTAFGLAADFGHLDALNIPVIDQNAAVSTVIMTSAEPLSLSDPDRSLLTVLGTSFAHRGMEIVASESAFAGSQLTRREAQCLAWVADGKSDWAIGEILSIAQPTVHMHIENARRKLGCRSRHQTVLEAWRRGWLVLPDDDVVPRKARIAAALRLPANTPD